VVVGATSAEATLLDATELAAWRGLLRTQAALTKQLDAELISAHGIPLSSYEVLLHLHEAPEGKMRMAELAESVLLSRSGLTRLVDRMEREGLIRREPCTEDARGWFAAITDTGREVFARARITHLDGVRERFLSHFSREELALLGDAWRRVLPDSAP
jgi:DNA-binding MarR family transcriptional regulator